MSLPVVAVGLLDREDVTVYGSGTAPLAIAHRGGAGLALENTMAAFERSHALGLRHLELDVRLSADGVPVVFHDSSLSRLAGLRQSIGQLSVAELAGVVLHGRHRIPMLADVLTRFPDSGFAIDVKEPGAMAGVVDVITRVGARRRVCLTGGWDTSLRRGREMLGADVATSLGWRGLSATLASGRSGLRTPWWRTGATYAHAPLRLGAVPTYAPGLVDRVHDLGLRLVIWAVRTSEEMHRVLDDGVDGIITDHPDVLREVLIARDQWTSAARVPRLHAGTSAGAVHAE